MIWLFMACVSAGGISFALIIIFGFFIMVDIDKKTKAKIEEYERMKSNGKVQIDNAIECIHPKNISYKPIRRDEIYWRKGRNGRIEIYYLDQKG